MNRKQHSDEAGYPSASSGHSIAERMNPYVPGTKVVIYIAAEAGIDAWGKKFAIVCIAHANIVGTWSLAQAREFMKQPDDFCTQCLIDCVNPPKTK